MKKLFFLFVIVACTFISCKKGPICESCPGPDNRGNKPPVANAGRDTTITLPLDSVVLDGSASFDPDGHIRNYNWRNISALPCNISNQGAAKATAKNLVAGTYKFELNVTDDDLAFSTNDTVVVIVLYGVATRPPVANAGPDQTITLPTNSATLNGSKSYDSSGAQLSFLWKQITGAQGTISSPTTASTVVSFVSHGVFQFELQVSNSYGRALDTVVVTVHQDDCKVSRKSLSVQVNQLTSQPAPHGERIMVASGNKLYFPVFSHEVMNIYDVSSGNWTSTPLPADEFKDRLGIAIVAVENKIFFAGGHYYDVWGILASNSVNIYDISTNTWSRAQLSEPRGLVKAAVVGNKVVFAGGLNEDQRVYSKTVDIYELQTNTWSKAKMKGTPRAVAAAVTAGNKIFFIGGYTGFVAGPMWDVMGNPTKEIDIYDASTGQWTTTAMQITRENFAAIAAGDKIYIAGGTTGQWGTQLTADVEVIDVHSLSRTNTCLSQPTGLYTQSVARLNHLIVFFAGTNKLDVYNTVTGEWLVADLPNGTWSYAQIAVENGELYILDNSQITTPRLFKLKL